MRELNDRLAAHFARLRDTRQGDVYFIEHGLTTVETFSLLEKLRLAISEHPVTSGWWELQPLPLVVAVTETGYRFRGVGTDFWPVFEAELGTSIGLQGRLQIRDFFRRSSELYRGAKPPDTRWARAFHLIAWPITHAVLPVEFHSQISEVLSGLRLRVAEVDDEHLYRAIRQLRSRPSARFETFLKNQDVVIAIARSLLGERVELLSHESVERFKVDIEANRAACRNVSLAKRIQSALEKDVDALWHVDPQSKIHGRLNLRQYGRTIRLEATFPLFPPAIVDRMRRAMRRVNFAPRLWGISERVNGEQLISGTQFPVQLKGAIPTVGQDLLIDLTGLELELDLLRLLRSLSLELKVPMAFAVEADGDGARAVYGQEVSASRKYWILYRQNTTSGLSRLPIIGQIEGLVIALADPQSDQGRKALRDLGLRIRYQVPISIAGPPELDPNTHIPEFAVGDRRVLIAREAVPQGTLIRLGDEESPLTEDFIAFSVARGEQVLEVVAEGNARQYIFRGVDSARRKLYPVCRIELMGAEPTVQSLLSGALGIRIDSLVPIEGLTLRLELDFSGSRVGVATALGALPQLVSAGDEPWPTLLDEGTRDSVMRAARVRLHVQVGVIAKEVFELEQRIQPCWWEGDGFAKILNSELGEIEHGVIPIDDPLASPQLMSINNSVVGLLSPINVDPVVNGTAAAYSTYCVAPPRLSLQLPPLSKPHFLRRRTSLKDGVGLDQLLRGYFRWSQAESLNLTAEIRRRQVVSIIEGWLSEVSCGKQWAELEAILAPKRANPWKLFETYCVESSFGIDTYVQPTNEEIASIVRLATAEVQRIRPDLWLKVGDLSFPDCEELDEAFAKSYQILADNYLSRGMESDATRIAGGDPGATPEEWNLALGNVYQTFLLRDLNTLLFPTNLTSRLVEMDYTVMSFSDLCAEFVRFAKSARRALYGTVPREDTLEIILAIWLAPTRAIAGNWPSAADVLVAERGLARASRYMALRWRQTPQGGRA